MGNAILRHRTTSRYPLSFSCNWDGNSGGTRVNILASKNSAAGTGGGLRLCHRCPASLTLRGGWAPRVICRHTYYCFNQGPSWAERPFLSCHSVTCLGSKQNPPRCTCQDQTQASPWQWKIFRPTTLASLIMKEPNSFFKFLGPVFPHKKI